LLGFHLLLKEARGFFLQTNVHGSVTNQVTVATGAAKRLKQYVLLAILFRDGASGPKPLQRILRGFQLAGGD
jgi:hypothetical protein